MPLSWLHQRIFFFLGGVGNDRLYNYQHTTFSFILHYYRHKRKEGKMKLTKSLAESPCHVADIPFPYTSHPLSLLNLVRKLALASPIVRFSFLINTSNSNSSRFLSPIFQASLPDNFTAYDHVEDGVPAGYFISGNSAEAMEFFLEASPENFKKAIDIVVPKTGTKITCLLVDALLSTCFADYLALCPLSFTPTSFANAALIAVLQLLIIKMKSLVLFLVSPA